MVGLADFSPDGELLFLAWPRKSNQKEGHPSSPPFGFPNRSERTGASPTRPNRLHKTQSVAELKHGSAFFPSVHFDSAIQQGEPGEKWSRVSELRSTGRFVPRVRASCGSAPCGEHRREAVGRHSRGRLSLVTFFGEAKKVTRPKAKSAAGFHP